MSEQILSAVHGVTTMLFGIYCSAFFLGIKPIRKNILTMFLLFSGQGLLYVIDLALFGETLANMSYPLIVHFPLVLFLSVHYKYPLISSAVSVFSAYLCCQISNWTGLFALAITGLQWCYYSVRILTTTLTFVLLYRYVFRSTKTIFTKMHVSFPSSVSCHLYITFLIMLSPNFQLYFIPEIKQLLNSWDLHSALPTWYFSSSTFRNMRINRR